ncbi:MAG: hypothetical protein EZS28_013170 [Streblomastix strix]|uniref:Uncharacterized protein n=1 Tax=Streblomastix strix TaxID=222440 RepID=A0A5J4W9G1_9EUKA|nr:MAG: hypothetical protein EZS28_013170 [Streblomastix strix]
MLSISIRMLQSQNKKFQLKDVVYLFLDVEILQPDILTMYEELAFNCGYYQLERKWEDVVYLLLDVVILHPDVITQYNELDFNLRQLRTNTGQLLFAVFHNTIILANMNLLRKLTTAETALEVYENLQVARRIC